jgi:UDP-3-O-[3-hydroxymyristoyl] glucosamine N-acyltransferase
MGESEMTMTVSELASHVGGTIVGEASLLLLDALPLQDAGASQLTLVDDLKHAALFTASPASVAIAPRSIAEKLAEQSSKTVLGCDNIHLAFIHAIGLLRKIKTTSLQGIDSRASIHSTVGLGEEVYVASGATIGYDCQIGSRSRVHAGVHVMRGCRIGNDCELFPGVVLYPGTVVGDRVTIHANAVIGAFGFGYRMNDGKHERTAQLGWVEIQDDVEIGAGSAIDRGTYGPTRIGTGTKIDNLCQIGHNNQIGEHNLLCGQVGIAGSCSTGKYVVIGGQVGMRDHTRVGDGVMIAAQAGVANDVADGEVLFGSPALPQRESMQIFMASKRLPEMRKELRELRAMLETLMEASTAAAPPTLKKAA